jgi:RimJ/RimL family protein N-acetyltransferase
MDTETLLIHVRPAELADAKVLCDLLNVIIRIGGTTAFEIPLTVDEFTEYFLSGPYFISCFVAEDEKSGFLLGFQALGRHVELPDDWGDIASYARPEPKIAGVGTALFAATKVKACESALSAINATIRADNAGGLAFYKKMGFEDYKITKAVRLRDGTPVDRVSKRYFVPDRC